MRYKRIRSVSALQRAMKNGHHEFAVLLNGGAYSRKIIYPLKDGLYQVDNCIDDSTQVLTEKEMTDRSITHVGYAMILGAFIQLD